MKNAAVASIAIAALALAAVSTVAHVVPLGQVASPAPESAPAVREQSSDPAPAVAPEPPPPAPEPVRAPPSPPAAPGSPPFPPHPMFASYMVGATPAEILERYDKQPSYRSWFDDHFGVLTIRQATGFDASPLPSGSPALAPTPAPAREPTPPKAIPDPNTDPPSPPPPRTPPQPIPDPDPDPRFVLYMTAGDDPQVYVDRYNDDPSYKAWFDANFEGLTIQQAAGLGSAPPQPRLLPPPPAVSPPPPPQPVAPTPQPAPPTTQPPEPTTQPDNSAECNRLVAKLFNPNISDEEFDRIEAELTANNCRA